MISISSRGIPELVAWLKGLTVGSKMVATRAFAEYLIGNDSHGLKHSPARVQHGPNNPYQWTSGKQRRAYFASNGFGGGIPYQRTGQLSSAWTLTEQDSNWTMAKIQNATPYARYVQGKDIQRGHVADKWRTAWDIIKTNLAGAFRSANAAVKRWAQEQKRG